MVEFGSIVYLQISSRSNKQVLSLINPFSWKKLKKYLKPQVTELTFFAGGTF